MLKSILTGILAAGFSLILPAAPAYRDVFSEADRADNAMLQPFQKKEQKLYTFVPDAGSGPVRITAEGAALCTVPCAEKVSEHPLYSRSALSV